MIKRLFTFDREDWRHVGFILGNMFKAIWQEDVQSVIEGYYLMKLHINYDHKRMVAK